MTSEKRAAGAGTGHEKASDGRTYVEIADQNNQPEKRYITTGISDSVDIQVLSGLRLGKK